MMIRHLLLTYGLVAQFVAALQGHNVIALRSLGVTESAAFSYPLRDALDRYVCIVIDSWAPEAVEGDADVVRIRVHGSGMAVNARHDWKPIPDSWIVRIASTPAGPRIDMATTEDHYVAQHIIAAPDDAGRDEIIAEHPEFTAHDLLHAVLDELEETPELEHIERSESLHFVI